MSRQATIRLPSLLGGISRQPATARLPEQVEDAENVLFSIRHGACKRPGSWLVGRVCPALPPTQNIRMHKIERDEQERYIVLYAAGGFLRVYRKSDWTRATVNISANAAAYLAMLQADADDLRFRTLLDATYIVNSRVPTRVLTSDAYTLTATWRDYDVMTSQTPADQTYHRTLEDTPEQNKGYWQYDVDGTTFATARFQEVNGSTWASPTGNWNNSAGSPYGFTINFRRLVVAVTAGTWDSGPNTLTQAGVFANYTWQAGDMIRITGGTGATPGWYAIASKTNDNTIVLSASFGADNVDTTADAIGTQHEVLFNTDGADTAEDMFEIAERIEEALQATAPDALVSWTSTGFQAGYFTVTAPYRGTNAAVYAPTAPSGGTDLTNDATDPFRAATVVLTAGSGSGSVTLAVEDRWDRVLAPSQPDATPDPTRMPIRMVRTSTSPLVFTVDTVTWDSRLSGDEETNPAPKLFTEGRAIADIAFVADRLVLCGEDKVLMGRTGDYHDFYQQDAENIVDSDPIEVPISSDEHARIDFAAPFRKSLTLFTKAGRQFDLKASEDLYAPGRVTISASTRYETRPVRPEAIDRRLYFAGASSKFSSLLEYEYDEVSIASEAADVSAHCPGLLIEAIRTIVASSNQKTVIVVPGSGGISFEMLVYRFHFVEQRKLQSAWARWGFDAWILDVVIFDADAYVLLLRDGAIVMERVSLEPESPLAGGNAVPTCGAAPPQGGSGSGLQLNNAIPPGGNQAPPQVGSPGFNQPVVHGQNAPQQIGGLNLASVVSSHVPPLVGGPLTGVSSININDTP